MKSLRDEGILIVVSGMAVHNLRDMWRAMQRVGPMGYTSSFDRALKEAVEVAVCDFSFEFFFALGVDCLVVWFVWFADFFVAGEETGGYG